MQHILELRQLSDPTDLIRTGMILALYETYDSAPDQDDAWQVHVEAACNLMRQSHLSAGALNDHDLRRLYTIEVGCCISFQDTAPYLLTGLDSLPLHQWPSYTFSKVSPTARLFI